MELPHSREIIYGQVPGNRGTRRIIKDEAIRQYERSFAEQCTVYKNCNINSRFKLIIDVWHSSMRFDLDNMLKTVLDCLQHVDPDSPRIEFLIIPKQPNLFVKNK